MLGWTPSLGRSLVLPLPLPHPLFFLLPFYLYTCPRPYLSHAQQCSSTPSICGVLLICSTTNRATSLILPTSHQQPPPLSSVPSQRCQISARLRALVYGQPPVVRLDLTHDLASTSIVGILIPASELLLHRLLLCAIAASVVVVSLQQPAGRQAPQLCASIAAALVSATESHRRSAAADLSAIARPPSAATASLSFAACYCTTHVPLPRRHCSCRFRFRIFLSPLPFSASSFLQENNPLLKP